MAKRMWIIAGPNGAGKATFTNDLLASAPDLLKLNADERTAALRAADPKTPQRDLNLRAAKEIHAQVVDCIAKGQSFLVETVLSSDKYRDDVIETKKQGFKISLVYVSLHPPELSPDRVATRVIKGSHDVDRQTAIDRHARSHIQLAWFAAKADVLAMYDTSRYDATPQLIAERAEGQQLRVHARGINPAGDRVLKLDKPPTRRRKGKRGATPT